MMRFIYLFILLVAAVLPFKSADAQSFEGLGFGANGGVSSEALGISANGAVVVGRRQREIEPTGAANTTRVHEAFRWTASGGMVILDPFSPVDHFGYPIPTSIAYASSYDGSTVVGGSVPVTNAFNEGAQWAPDGSITSLDCLPPPGSIQTIECTAYSVTPDGMVAVGFTLNESDVGGVQADHYQAARWVNGTIEGLGWLALLGVGGDNSRSSASDISDDGSIIVGYSTSESMPGCDGPYGCTEAFRWEGGAMVGLGVLGAVAEQEPRSRATAISGNGRVIVGHSSSVTSGTRNAFRWEDGEMRSLGLLPSAQFESVATAVSADGSVIVGWSSDADDNETAFIWTEEDGMRSVRDVLSEQGLALTGWTLTEATDVSANGVVIVGTGLGPNGADQAWRAELGPSMDIVVNDDRDLADLDETDGICDADIEASGEQCTLRAAIVLANARGGATITFDIDVEGVPRIEVPAEDGGLPVIEAPVTIDGTTQAAGWVEVTRSSQDGTQPHISGITVGADAGGSVIRGLVINGFDEYGILIQEGADGCMIEGNRVGTDATGLRARPNGWAFILSGDVLSGGGVRVDSDENEIRKNLLAGNWTANSNPGACCGGVDLWLGPTANLNRVYGNNFGTDVNGDPILLHEPSALNGGYLYLGLFLQGDDNKVGGSEADANVFNGTVMGLLIWGDDNEISYNRIGHPDPSGITADTFPLNNSGIALGASTGVSNESANGTLILENAVTVADGALHIRGNGNTARANYLIGQVPYGPRLDSRIQRNFQNAVEVIGVENSLEANLITSNVWGINVQEGSGNLIDGNTIEAGWGGIGFHRNVPPDEPAEALITANSITAPYFGIDFGDEAYVPNDVTDSDSGPNTLLNYPVVTQATWDGQGLSVEGFVQTALVTTATYTIEVFGASACTSLPPQADGIPGAWPGAARLFASGEQYIGRGDAAAWLGEAYFALALGAPAGHPVITLTASRHDLGVTSHFGQCVRPTAPGQTARAEVDSGETGLVLDAQGVTVTVTQASTSAGTAAGQSGVRRSASGQSSEHAGTLYLSRYETAPETSFFADATATAPGGSAVRPEFVATRYWLLADRGLTTAGGAEGSTAAFEICLDPTDVVLPASLTEVLLVQRNEASGGLWQPHATFSRDHSGATYLCSNDLTTLGEFGLGGASASFPVSIQDDPSESTRPTVPVLSAYPNPGSGVFTLALTLPDAGDVRMEVYDILGRRVNVLHEGRLTAGTHTLSLNASRLTPGLYFVRAAMPDGLSVSRQLTVVR